MNINAKTKENRKEKDKRKERMTKVHRSIGWAEEMGRQREENGTQETEQKNQSKLKALYNKIVRCL
jgi:hypothetical protein